MRTLLLALVLIAAPAMAGEPVGPAEFRDYAEGWTLYFEHEGEPFGQERFEEGGATLWRFRDGSCMEGAWAPHGAQLCFYYGEGAEVLCWRALRDGQGLYFRLLGDGPDAGMELRVTGRDRRRPICGEPGRET
ncbi:MAG TPA: hypothetical protein VMM59_10700 [Thermohalobaculum sp.]|nr:hypothetical protein [Thermohalobaculum sp.]